MNFQTYNGYSWALSTNLCRWEKNHRQPAVRILQSPWSSMISIFLYVSKYLYIIIVIFFNYSIVVAILVVVIIWYHYYCYSCLLLLLLLCIIKLSLLYLYIVYIWYTFIIYHWPTIDTHTHIYIYTMFLNSHWSLSSTWDVSSSVASSSFAGWVSRNRRLGPGRRFVSRGGALVT